MDVNAILSPYGLAGLIIFVESGVILWYHKDRIDWINRYIQLQEARRLDNVETAKALSETMNSFTQAVEMLNEKVQTVQQRRRK